MAFRDPDSLAGLLEASALENVTFCRAPPAMVSDGTNPLAGEPLREGRERQGERASEVGERANGSEVGRNRADWEWGGARKTAPRPPCPG